MEEDRYNGELQAEVSCVTCKQRRWVSWEARHDGKNVAAPHHKVARCPACPTGCDHTVFTGRHRGIVEVKGP